MSRWLAAALFLVLGLLKVPLYSDFIYEIPTDFISLDIGYRWDKLSNRAVLYGPLLGTRVSTQSFEDLNSFQAGIKGQFSVCRWVLKGSVYHGWVNSGHYHEADFRGNVDGYTNDASGAVGYYFSVNDNWTITPFIGYAYDKFNLHVRHGKVPLSGFLVDTGAIHCEQRFEGPWIGFDFRFRPFCYDIQFSYELHYAKWRARKSFHEELGTDFGVTTGFSNKRNHPFLWGNVFQMNISYLLTPDWNMGIALKYEFYTSVGTGHYSRTKVPLALDDITKSVAYVEWESFSAYLHADYNF